MSALTRPSRLVTALLFYIHIVTFVQVSASDRDSGTNSLITYSIISGDDAVKKFEINANSGIMLNRSTTFALCFILLQQLIYCRCYV